MLSSNPSVRHHQLLHCLHQLPQKVMAYQEHDNVAAFVLHELCHSSQFNLEKAAYLVNNPDFDCLRGIAGFTRHDAFDEFDMHWRQPEEFSLRMKSSPFNSAVRELYAQSLKHNDVHEAASVTGLAEQLGIEQPQYISWDLRHDNHGYLVYQAPEDHDEQIKSYLQNGVFVLSFCPLF